MTKKKNKEKNPEECAKNNENPVDKSKEKEQGKEKIIENKDAQKIQELTENLQRLQAEFENYKKRVEKEFIEFRKYANEELISELLLIIDNFELAIKNKDKKEDFVKGVELIFSQFYELLEKKGLKVIESEGKKFDPCLHEALLKDENADFEQDMITEELQKGYLLGDKVLRHSKVKVNKKPAEAGNSEV